jgi:hypothetical protein
MAQFKAFAPEVEINGVAVLSVIKAMGTFRQTASNILGEHGIVAPEEGAWYSQQAWLDTFKEIAETMGDITLRMIGEKIPEVALWPPDIDTVGKALASIDVAYHMNHRGGRIGHYTLEEVGKRSGKMVCENPYPCDLDMGIIESTASRFAAEGVQPTVKHDRSQCCRKEGGDACTYLVTW